MGISSTSMGACAIVTILLTGCTLGPDFARPGASATASYSARETRIGPAGEADRMQTLVPGQAVAANWWRAFASAELDEAIEAALMRNPTLEAAEASVAQAERLVSAAQGALYPQIDLSLSAQASRTIASGASSHAIVHSDEIGPVLAFDPDLFGAKRRTVEQQRALADVQRYQLAAAYLSLTGNVVAQAIDIGAAREQLQAINDIVAIDERNVELVQIGTEAGKLAHVDVLAAQSQLANDRALLPPLQQQLDVARDAFAVLGGTSPGELHAPEFDLSSFTLPTELPVTMPSALVRARPDILAAEAQLHAASAAIGIATAGLYPDVALSAAWTEQSASLGRLFSGPAGLWEFAADLVAPVFHGGTLEAQREATIEAYAARLASYRATVIQAFGQVADALHALEHDAQSLAAQQSALATARVSLELTQQSFVAGQANLVQLLQAQRLFEQARLGYAKARGQRYADTAQLFVAMGGEWREWLERPGTQSP
ncbi:MAG TPA: efflux transporter outer membrane subunit [Casimicrobiaceae bacterium]|nr:efflux transporter outer membrane subunit [Casimicrobiaceae bacterium]